MTAHRYFNPLINISPCFIILKKRLLREKKGVNQDMYTTRTIVTLNKKNKIDLG